MLLIGLRKIENNEEMKVYYNGIKKALCGKVPENFTKRKKEECFEISTLHIIQMI